MRREEKRLVSLHECRDGGTVNWPIRPWWTAPFSVMTVAGTITGKPVRVFPDCPEPGQYTIHAGLYSFTFPGELERVRTALRPKPGLS